jgi:hypothetical protein
MVAPGFMKGVLAMSALLTKDRSPISSNMSLEQIAHIRDLPHRALALSYTEALTPESALALALVKSVDVPEAGSWGANAVARMASLKAALKTVRGRKKRQVAFDGQPNLFIAFANVDDAHEPLVATEDMAGVDSSMHTSEQEGK